jgi:hypothetical protein
MEEEPLATPQEPNFDDFTTEELFDHLTDLYIIPYEDEFSKWRELREQMLYMCKETYERRTI